MLLRADPAVAPHQGGVLAIDDSGDHKDGHATAHVSRQWLLRHPRIRQVFIPVSARSAAVSRIDRPLSMTAIRTSETAPPTAVASVSPNQNRVQVDGISRSSATRGG
ncbi:transposase [Streptosporangium canum]